MAGASDKCQCAGSFVDITAAFHTVARQYVAQSRHSENAIRLMLTALSISSMLINTLTAFLLLIKPQTPVQNSTAATKR